MDDVINGFHRTLLRVGRATRHDAENDDGLHDGEAGRIDESGFGCKHHPAHARPGGAQGKGGQFHLAAFKAYFADGLNLAKQDVLLGLVREIGLPEEEALTVITGRTYGDKVDKDWSDSRFMGITAVPTFVMGQHKLVGAQPYDSLAELVSLYGAELRPGAQTAA